MRPWIWSAERALTAGLVILGLVGLASCVSSEEDASTTTSSVQTSASTASSVSATSAGTVPSYTEPILEDGAWEFRIDRIGGSEDLQEAFEWLPEARYEPMENGPTYRVVISEQGNQVSIEGTRGATHFVQKGRRTSTPDEHSWYDLTDAFAGGRFIVWQIATGLQGGLTLYGSGRPILFSERGALIKAP